MRLRPPPRKRRSLRRRDPGRRGADPRCWGGPRPGVGRGRPRCRRRAWRPRRRPPRRRVRAGRSRRLRPARERAWRSTRRRSPRRQDPADGQCRLLPRAAGRTPRAPPAEPALSAGPIRGPPRPDRRATPRRPRRRRPPPSAARPRRRACATGRGRSRSLPPRPAPLRKSPRGRTGHRRPQRRPADPRSIGSARRQDANRGVDPRGAFPVRKGISSPRLGLGDALADD